MTSYFFGLGKAHIFSKPGQIINIIIESGERAFVSLYGTAKDDRLDDLHYEKFSDKVLKGAVHVEPQSLPPSSTTNKYHCLYVYQIMEWIEHTELDPKV